jgi:ketosteroid isomerase-like protein
MSKANVALVQNLYAAFQRGDVGTIIAALEPDIVWHSHGRPEDYPTLGLRQGPREVEKFFQTIGETAAATDFSPRDYDAVGEKVFVRGHYGWTVHKTGKHAASDWMHIFTIKGGKVAVFDEFTDTARFAAAMRG